MTPGVIIFPLIFISMLIILAEFCYSKHRKDYIYSTRGTIVNIVNGLFLVTVSTIFITLYLSHLPVWIPVVKAASAELNITSMLIGVIIIDFLYYLFHRAHHNFLFFWMSHQVHHGDNSLNLSTAYRISWLEQTYLFLFFIPALLVGTPSIVVLFSFYLLCFHQFICHSQYLKLPHFLSYLFITPQTHRIHHDQKRENQNSNFGGIFSIWDKLFGTYVDTIDTFTPGIKGYKQDNFIMMYLDPFKKFLLKSKK